MTDIYLDESDSRRLIKEKLMKDNATTLLNEVLSQDNQQLPSCPNHYSKEQVEEVISKYRHSGY